MVEAKILIADDSKMNQQILSEILGGRYEYLYADDGMQALELLLLDINMPRLDGFGVLEVMKQRNWLQEIPVIITSSEDDESFIQKAYTTAGDELLQDMPVSHDDPLMRTWPRLSRRTQGRRDPRFGAGRRARGRLRRAHE